MRDVDITLYLKRISREKIFDYEQEIADILEREIKYPADVKVLNFAPFYFLNSIFRSGKLLFSRDGLWLSKLIEESSQKSMINCNFSRQSLQELVS